MLSICRTEWKKAHLCILYAKAESIDRRKFYYLPWKLDYFSEPTLKVLLRLSVSQIMDQNEAVIVVVENVARIAMTMGATQVTQF